MATTFYFDSKALFVSDPSTRRAKAITGLIVVGCGVAVGPLDTAVNIAFPAIVGEFQLPLEMIQWIIICYVLTYSSLTLIAGKLGDRYGRRRIFKIGLAASCIGLAACSLAPSFGALLPARVAQGLGTALAIACGPALATSLYPESLRSRVIGYYAAMFAAAGAIGPVIGGALTDAFGWQAVFWFRIPLALTVLGLLWTLPSDRNHRDLETSFDFLGAILLVATLASFALALSLARWGLTVEAICVGFLGFVSAVFFVRVEKTASDPVLQIRAFQNVRFCLLNVLNIIICGATFTPLLFTPFFLTRHAGFDAASGGLALAIGALGAAIAAALAGRMIERISGATVAVFGASLAALGLGLIGQVQTDATLAEVILTLAIAGVGLGLFQTAYLDGVTSILPEKDRGVAGGLAMVTRTIGVIAAASMLTLLFSHVQKSALQNDVGAVDAFLQGYNTVFLVAAASAFAGATLAWSFRRFS
jgi:EmrB/QacA subfamily drug resistance transporter